MQRLLWRSWASFPRSPANSNRLLGHAVERPHIQSEEVAIEAGLLDKNARDAA